MSATIYIFDFTCMWKSTKAVWNFTDFSIISWMSVFNNEYHSKSSLVSPVVMYIWHGLTRPGVYRQEGGEIVIS